MQDIPSRQYMHTISLSSPVAPGLYGSKYDGQYSDMPVRPIPQMPRPYARGTGGRPWRARSG